MSKNTSLIDARSNLNTFFRNFPDFGIRITQHARERMRERGIGLPQIRTVLKSGAVHQFELDIKTGLDKYRVVGSDADGRTLEVVVNLDDTGKGHVVFITAIESKGANDSGRRRRRHGGRRPLDAEKGGYSGGRH